MIPPSLNTKLIFFQNMNPERGRKLGERADDPVIADVFQNMNPERGRKR